MKLPPLLLALSLVGTFVVLIAPSASACAPLANCFPKCVEPAHVCVNPFTCTVAQTCPILRCIGDLNSCIVFACIQTGPLCLDVVS